MPPSTYSGHYGNNNNQKNIPYDIVTMVGPYNIYYVIMLPFQRENKKQYHE